MADAAGAVEIDEHLLKRIEDGVERPTEDILLLLINHFSMSNAEADKLWELAGYEPPKPEEETYETDRRNQDEPNNSRAAMLVLAIDPRVVFSDGAQVVANSKGVVINFAQSAGTPQALVTARVGMSREQAYSLLDTLKKTLADSEPRQLSAGDSAAQPQEASKDTAPDQKS